MRWCMHCVFTTLCSTFAVVGACCNLIQHSRDFEDDQYENKKDNHNHYDNDGNYNGQLP